MSSPSSGGMLSPKKGILKESPEAPNRETLYVDIINPLLTALKDPKVDSTGKEVLDEALINLSDVFKEEKNKTAKIDTDYCVLLFSAIVESLPWQKLMDEELERSDRRASGEEKKLEEKEANKVATIVKPLSTSLTIISDALRRKTNDTKICQEVDKLLDQLSMIEQKKTPTFSRR